MEAVLAECQRCMAAQRALVEEEQQRLLDQVLKAHKENVAELRAENEELRRQLDTLAEQQRKQACVPGPGACGSGTDPEEVTESVCESMETPAGGFPGWGRALTSDVVRLRAIGEDGVATVCMHRVVLQRSPYFQARLARRWSDSAAADSDDRALPLRLPVGCTVRSAMLLFRLLYCEDEGCFGVANLAIQDAATAVAVAQLAGMLLFDSLQAHLANLACSLLTTGDEALELQRRFVALPNAVAAASKRAFDTVSLESADLSRMLQGTARSPAAWPQAEKVLAAHGRSAVCMQAVLGALQAMPFKVSKTDCGTRIDGQAFEWLWGLVHEYLLIPGADVSLLSFFEKVATMQELHSNSGCQSHAFCEDSVHPLRRAFGKYLTYLANIRSNELSKAFRLGVIPEMRVSASHRPQNCWITYSNVLFFGSWSRALLPRLLRIAGPLQGKLRAHLLELPTKALASLIDDNLLQAFGGESAAVCERLVKDPQLLLQWVTRRRLLAMPLLARRDLCISLAPSLGALPGDIAGVVVDVMAGGGTKDLEAAAAGATSLRGTCMLCAIVLGMCCIMGIHALQIAQVL